jgi:alpha-1,6-mannosyltransferase
MKAIPVRLILTAAIIEILLVGLRTYANLQAHLVGVIALLLLTSLVYIVAVYLITGGQRTCGDPAKVSGRVTSADEGSYSKRTQQFILAAAILFRFTVFPIFPALSDDVYRYRWEGKLQAYGGNPYQVPPIDPSWAKVRDTTWENVGSKDFKTIYGPLIELQERWTYKAVSGLKDEYAQVFWFKLPSVICELGLIWSVAALLRLRGIPADRLLVYAWSPIPLVEFWIGGHNDALVVLFIVLALVGAAANRWPATFLALSVAIVAKVWPLVLLPAFLWRSRKAGWLAPAWALIVLPLAAVLWIPYSSRVLENAQFASGFVGGWRNNDSLFGAVLWLADGDLYRAKYTTFALIAVVAAAVAVTRWSLEKAVFVTILALLFLSANCHPWYLTWFVPLLTFFPYTPILLWTALMPLSYSVLIGWKTLGVWNGSTPLRWFIYVPVLATSILCLLKVLGPFASKNKQSSLVLR